MQTSRRKFWGGMAALFAPGALAGQSILLPSGSSGGTPQTLLYFSDAETPTPPVNGSNTAFTLAYLPVPAASVAVFLNGQCLTQGIDYTLAGNILTFTAAPAANFVLRVSYRHN